VIGASNEGTLLHTPQVPPNIVQKDVNLTTVGGLVGAAFV